MDADGGHAARRGDQPAAGQHLPAPAGSNGWRRLAIGWCAMRTTSWFCARAAKRPKLPWRRSADGWRRTACVCIRTKRMIGDCRQPGQGFEFLGYRFEAGQRWVRKKSLARLKREHPGKDATHARREPRADRRRPQPDAEEGGSATSSTPTATPSSARRLHPASAARAPAQAGQAARLRPLKGRP